MNTQQILEWFRQHPEVTNFRAAACDINGVWRGKRVPVEQLEKVLMGEMRMPVSSLSLDIWGRDIEDSPLVFATGDADGRMIPTGRGILPINDEGHDTAIVPLTMLAADDSPSPVDPRQILAIAKERAAAMGLFPVMAIEMEFYLVDPSKDQPRSPRSPVTGKRLMADSILSIDELSHFEKFFQQVYSNCRLQGVSVDTAISESGRGQFEINLLHQDDPLRAADDAVFFKNIVKLIARRNKLAASFMAKPYVNRPGSGMHVHFSLLDREGRNVFDDGGQKGSDQLRYAVAGLLGTMSDCALFWAPHFNSYRRFEPRSHAPTGICWGYDNRTASLRIPGGSPNARRIEHRISGADVNPYLTLAAIIHAALDGIEAKTEPEAPITGDGYALDLERMPRRWMDAIRLFEESEFMKRHFDPLFVDVYCRAKRQESDEIHSRISDFEISSYLETV